MIDLREPGNVQVIAVLGLVLLAVLGVGTWMRTTASSGDESAGQTLAPFDPAAASDPSALEVNPMVSRGHIVTASWHTNGAGVDEEDEEDESVGETGRSGWNRVEQDAESRERREAALRGVVSQVGGLGIHVAREHNDDE